MISNSNEASNFILKELDSFIKLFPQTRVRYEFDLDANVHCVEVVPNNVYHLNNDFIVWERKITDAFIALFPNQNICFFSDDAFVGINNVHHEFIGSQYLELIPTSLTNPVIPSSKVNFSCSNNFSIVGKISTSVAVLKSETFMKFFQSNNEIGSANSLNHFENNSEAYLSPDFSMAA